MNSTVNRFDRTVFTGADADTHDGFALVGHDRLDVGKVEVDETGRRDQVGNALNALAEYVVSDEESVFEGRLLVDDLEQLIIGDGNDGIDLFFQVVGTLFGNFSAALAFK